MGTAGVSAAVTAMAALGLLVVVWMAARVAVLPGEAMPVSGQTFLAAAVRTVGEESLDPLIGIDGSRSVFWIVSTVIIILATATVCALRQPVRRPRGQRAWRDLCSGDPIFVPVTVPWSTASDAIAREGTADSHAYLSQQDQQLPGKLRSETDAVRHSLDSTHDDQHALATPPNDGLWMAIGENNQHHVAVDLCRPHGLEMAGPGAHGCARYVLARLLAIPQSRHPTASPVASEPAIEQSPIVVVSPGWDHGLLDINNLDADTAAMGAPRCAPLWPPPDGPSHTVPDTTEPRAAHTPSVHPWPYQAPTSEAALDYLEQQILARQRRRLAQDDSRNPERPVVLFTVGEAGDLARLRGALSAGAGHRIAGIVVSEQASETTLAIEANGTVDMTRTRRDLYPPLSKVHVAEPQHLAEMLGRSNATASDTNPRHSSGSSRRAFDTSPAPTKTTDFADHSAPLNIASNIAGPDPASPLSLDYRLPRPPTGAPPTTSPTNAATDPGSDPCHNLVDAHAVLVIRCFSTWRITTPTPLENGHPATAGSRHHTDRTERALAPQDARLLACLALHPDGISTSALRRIMWPDTSDALAGPRLRTALNHLRTSLGHATGLPRKTFANHANGRYHLAATPRDPRIWVDYVQFAEAVRLTRTQTGQARLGALERMVALHAGPVLPDLDLDWAELDTLRESARRSTASALLELADHYLPSDLSKTTQLLERLLGDEPTNERVAMKLIEAHHSRHDTNSAERTYQRLVDQLARIGRTPSQALTSTLHNNKPHQRDRLAISSANPPVAPPINPRSSRTRFTPRR